MRGVRQALRGERGLTLIELLAATGIGVLIMGVLGTVFFQFTNMTLLQQDSLTLNHQLQSATSVLSRDVVSAQSGTATDGAPTKTLTLRTPVLTFGQADEPVTRIITYTCSTGDGILWREEASGPMVVARHIESVDFGPSGPVGTMVHIVITATIRSESRSATLELRRRSSDY